MKNLLIVIVSLVLLSSCVDRDPFRFCSQKPLEEVTYTFTGEWPRGDAVRVYYTNYRGEYDDFRAVRPFSFTENFYGDVIQRRVRFEMIPDGESDVQGIITFYEGTIIIGEAMVINGFSKVELDICN